MRKLSTAIARARSGGVNIPEDLERGLLARARTLKRRDRDRIRAGTITEETAERNAGSAALAEFLGMVNEDMEDLNQ